MSRNKRNKHQRKKKSRERRRASKHREQPTLSPKVAWIRRFYAAGGTRRLAGFETRGGGWIGVTEDEKPNHPTIMDRVRAEEALRKARGDASN